MSRQKYCNLIDQVSEKLGIEDSRLLYDDCNLQVNEIPFTLLHGGEVDGENLYIYCDFGDLPTEMKPLISQHLMANDLYLCGNDAPSFGFNAETGRALIVNRIALSQITFDSLIGVLVNVAAYVHMWRQKFFLTPTDVEPSYMSLPTTQVMH